MISISLHIPASAHVSVSTATPSLVLVYGKTATAAAALVHELRDAANRLEVAIAQAAS